MFQAYSSGTTVEKEDTGEIRTRIVGEIEKLITEKIDAIEVSITELYPLY